MVHIRMHDKNNQIETFNNSMLSLRKVCPNCMPPLREIFSNCMSSLKGICSNAMNACYVQLLLTIHYIVTKKKNVKNVAGQDSTEKHTMGCI